jgi:acyl-CoA hydrolase
MVEAGFIAAADLLPPQYVLCLKIHGMTFQRPVRPGEVIRFESKIALTGRSRLIAYVRRPPKKSRR